MPVPPLEIPVYPLACSCHKCGRRCSKVETDTLIEYDHLSLDDKGVCEYCREGKTKIKKLRRLI